MIGLLLWTILYPLGSLATRVGLEAHLKDSHYTPDVFTQELLSEDLTPGQRGKGLWDDVRAVHLVPDAFTPFHWKLILDRGNVWDVAGYTVFTEEPQTFITYAKPPQPLSGPSLPRRTACSARTSALPSTPPLRLKFRWRGPLGDIQNTYSAICASARPSAG